MIIILEFAVWKAAWEVDVVSDDYMAGLLKSTLKNLEKEGAQISPRGEAPHVAHAVWETDHV